jgi:hypothetical protein
VGAWIAAILAVALVAALIKVEECRIMPGAFSKDFSSDFYSTFPRRFAINPHSRPCSATRSRVQYRRRSCASFICGLKVEATTVASPALRLGPPIGCSGRASCAASAVSAAATAPAIDELLDHYRKLRADMFDDIAFWRRHGWRLRKNDEDITDKWLADQQSRTDELGAIVAAHEKA